MGRLQRTHRRLRAMQQQLRFRRELIERRRSDRAKLMAVCCRVTGGMDEKEAATLPPRWKISGGSSRAPAKTTEGKKRRYTGSCKPDAGGLQCGSQTPPPAPGAAQTRPTVNPQTLAETVVELYRPKLRQSVVNKYPAYTNLVFTINR
ncbi:ORF3 [torque teno Delphinidae virus 55]